MIITSTGNQKIKRLLNLRKKRKVRDEEKVFLVEGIRMFREVPVSELAEVYVSESFYGRERGTVETVLAGSSVLPQVLSDTVYDYISDTKTPQGVLCVVKQGLYSLEQAAGGNCPHMLVLDNLQDPGNLGTIIRTAEGAGVTGIVMSRDCVDLYNPKTIRSTMGSVYRMPFYYTEDIVETAGWMKDNGIRLYAAHLDGSRLYDQEDYTKPCAFLIGNEGNGLRKEVAQQADSYIRIPMAGQVESLNAAAAATVLMFEAGRQRRHQ